MVERPPRLTALQTTGEFANLGTVTFVSPLSVKFTSASRRWALPTLIGGALLVCRHAGAQIQEQRMDEILHADRNRTSEFAGKTFAASPVVGGKQAQVHEFAFSHSAVLHSGDGSFQTRSFANPKDDFRTREFATKPDRATGSDAFAQRDRGFATKALPVADALGSQKSANSLLREYVPGEKGIVIRGKRQGTLDEIRDQKNLSVDEVREILNKPNGRPGAKPPTSVAPALRALPVTSATVQ